MHFFLFFSFFFALMFVLPNKIILCIPRTSRISMQVNVDSFTCNITNISTGSIGLSTKYEIMKGGDIGILSTSYNQHVFLIQIPAGLHHFLPLLHAHSTDSDLKKKTTTTTPKHFCNAEAPAERLKICALK